MQVRACFAGRALARLKIGSCVGVAAGVERSQPQGNGKQIQSPEVTAPKSQAPTARADRKAGNESHELIARALTWDSGEDEAQALPLVESMPAYPAGNSFSIA